ncbi:MAG: murein biosynthesis integral membrane protein MurJ [Treponema sp.]|nr:murein biosynthesis integral membrane protein MurJ [Treponema sp.]
MSKTTHAISSMTILLLISRLFGFAREIIIAAYYGATYQTDAYNMAITIIGLSTALISAGVATIIIPMYNNKRLQQTKEIADTFVSNILWITSLFYVILSIIGIIFAPVLVRILAPNFEVRTAVLTVRIIRIMFAFTIATNISNLMTSILQVYNKFAITIIANFPFSIATVAIIVLFYNQAGIYALVIGYILFVFIQAFIIMLSVRKIFKFKAVLAFANGDLRDVLKLSLPMYISVAVWEINTIVDKILASGLPEGNMSAIMYALRLRSLPDGIITAAVMTVTFPLLSKYAANKEFAKLKESAVRAISLLFMVLLPVTVVSVYYASEITKIVYERGVFTPDKTLLTANIFVFAVVSLIFSGGTGLLNNVFYSMQDTKTPQIAAVIMVGFNITFNLILIRYMQAAGLALATSIASFAYFIVLFIQFRMKYGVFGGLILFKNVLKYIIAAFGMIPVFFIGEIFRGTVNLLLFFTSSSILALCVYVLLLYLLKAELFIDACKQVKIFVKSRQLIK